MDLSSKALSSSHTHTPKINNMLKSERIRLSIDIAISSSKD